LGLEAIAGPGDWLGIALDAVTSKEESWRRTCVRRRIQLYRDQYAEILREHITQVFKEPAVRIALDAFIPFVGGTSLIKRISDELARPLYARAPMRRVMMPGAEKQDFSKGPPPPSAEQVAYGELVREMELNARMDDIARLLTPSGAVFAGIRYLNRQARMTADVMTADMVSVVPDPDAPTKPLAIIFDSGWVNGKVTKYVCWDDVRTFSFDANGNLIGSIMPHSFGRIPVVDVHSSGRVGCYWNTSKGGDLESGALMDLLIDLITIRKLKTQSHIQLAYNGDVASFVKDQVSDEESILIGGVGGQIFPINLESDPTALLRAKEANETTVAANYGISRERLNQSGGEAGADEGLKERVAELANVLWHAEMGVFEVAKAVSQEHPKHKLPAEASLVVDLGQLHNRVDRRTQLDTFREEVRQGRKSFLDGVLEDNPEYGGNRALAMWHIREKARENGEVIEVLREANASLDSDAQEPGQTAEQNGALGPKVRDNKMSRDEAAERASTGRKPDAPA